MRWLTDFREGLETFIRGLAHERKVPDTPKPAPEPGPDPTHGPPETLPATEPPTMTTLGLGWLPDIPDHRDALFGVAETITPPEYLPKQVDHSQFHGPVVSQGQTSSCVGQSVKNASEYLYRAYIGEPSFTGSALHAYFNARYLGVGSIKVTDSGSYIRNGIKGAAQYGLCPEPLWPFNIDNVNIKPPGPTYNESNKREIRDYLRLTTLDEIKNALAKGYPVIIGFSCYDSFFTDKAAKTGLVDLPAQGEKLRGGHAVCLVGYSDLSKRLKFKNSWGPSWGDRGFGYLDYGYISPNLSDDYWCIRPKIEAAK